MERLGESELSGDSAVVTYPARETGALHSIRERVVPLPPLPRDPGGGLTPLTYYLGPFRYWAASDELCSTRRKPPFGLLKNFSWFVDEPNWIGAMLAAISSVQDPPQTPLGDILSCEM